MHLARYAPPWAFSAHITALFASVYSLEIKDEPLRGSRTSHFSLLQESLRLAGPVGLGGSLRKRHFRSNAVKCTRTAVSLTMTAIASLVLFGCLTFLLFEYGCKVAHSLVFLQCWDKVILCDFRIIQDLWSCWLNWWCVLPVPVPDNANALLTAVPFCAASEVVVLEFLCAYSIPGWSHNGTTIPTRSLEIKWFLFWATGHVWTFDPTWWLKDVDKWQKQETPYRTLKTGCNLFGGCAC